MNCCLVETLPLARHAPKAWIVATGFFSKSRQ